VNLVLKLSLISIGVCVPTLSLCLFAIAPLIWDKQNMEFLNNPTGFLDPCYFHVTFEHITPLEVGMPLPLLHMQIHLHFYHEGRTN